MTRPAVARRLDTITPASAAAAGMAAALLIVFVANYNVPKGENGGTWPGIIAGLGCLAVAGLLFGVIIPRLRHARRATLVLAVLAVISLAVYWSGITPVLAAAAVAATTDAAPSRRVLVARVTAAVAGLAAIVAVLVTSHLALPAAPDRHSLPPAPSAGCAGRGSHRDGTITRPAAAAPGPCNLAALTPTPVRPHRS